MSQPANANAGSDLPTSTHMSMLQQAQANDADAWRRLVHLYGPLVYSWCRRANLAEEDRADLFQEVFLAVAANLTTFRKDRLGDTFRGWLRVITSSKINDHFRRRQGKPSAQGGSHAYEQLLAAPAEASEESNDVMMNDPVRGLLRRALGLLRDTFDERTWQAFWRTTVEGQSSPDAAAALGVTPNAVRKAKARVLQRLREEFGDLLE